MAITQVHVRNVEHHARHAIAKRIGNTSGAVIGVIRDQVRPESVILHLNSGGNARAAELELRHRGYDVEPTDYNPFAPGHYGVKLRVGPQIPLELSPDRGEAMTTTSAVPEASTGRTPGHVVTDALRGEPRQSLPLTGVRADSGDPAADADTVIDGLGAMAVDALPTAGSTVQK